MVPSSLLSGMHGLCSTPMILGPSPLVYICRKLGCRCMCCRCEICAVQASRYTLLLAFVRTMTLDAPAMKFLSKPVHTPTTTTRKVDSVTPKLNTFVVQRQHQPHPNSQTQLRCTPNRAHRRGAGGATSNVGGRYKGQSLSGEKQLSVSEAVRTLLGHVFRSGGAGEAAARPAGVLGLG